MFGKNPATTKICSLMAIRGSVIRLQSGMPKSRSDVRQKSHDNKDLQPDGDSRKRHQAAERDAEVAKRFSAKIPRQQRSAA